jgi:hypothetical protein
LNYHIILIFLKSALKGLYAELPYHAKYVYYHDEVGNISNSHAIRLVKIKLIVYQKL